ncbi:MAG TPA: substrate-binding domain-containing protein [Acidimicrobiales bacterium]|nr:substrate-binding domain-containing protein [Acidimicrobiales bacterium]
MLRPLAPVLALLLLPACADDGGDRLTVLAASSLQGVVPSLVDGFQGDVDVAYGSSSRLVAQVRSGAPGDVILAADDVSLAPLGVPTEPFATTSMVVAVAPGNPGGVRSVADLTRVRTVLAAPEVPAGRYAAQVLTRAGVTVRPLSHELDARAVVAKVASGEVDAALVYAVDVGGLATVPLAAEHDVQVTYTLAVVKRTAAALAFVDFLRTTQGRQVLDAAGLGTP